MFTCFASINSTCDSKINKNNLFILHTFFMQRYNWRYSLSSRNNSTKMCYKIDFQ